MAVTYLTKEKLQELEAELNELKTKGRAEMARKISEAASHGDLRENGDYDAAKEEQGMLELKIHKIEKTLANARTINPDDFPEGEANILSNVTVFNRKSKKEVTYILVSAEEADFEQNKLAISSPIGKALKGHKEGDVVEARVPAGVIELEIRKIWR